MICSIIWYETEIWLHAPDKPINNSRKFVACPPGQRSVIQKYTCHLSRVKCHLSHTVTYRQSESEWAKKPLLLIIKICCSQPARKPLLSHLHARIASQLFQKKIWNCLSLHPQELHHQVVLVFLAILAVIKEKGEVQLEVRVRLQLEEGKECAVWHLIWSQSQNNHTKHKTPYFHIHIMRKWSQRMPVSANCQRDMH